MTKRLFVVGMLALVGLAMSFPPAPAEADEASVSDPDDSSGALDIASVSHGHGRSEGLVRHTLTTYEPWESSLLAASDDPANTWGRIFFTLNSRAFCCGSGTIIVKANPDGTLYARFHREGLRAYGRAWRPDDRSVTVEFAERDFKRDLTAYRWQGGTSYASPDNPECEGWSEVNGQRTLEACVDYTDSIRHFVAIEPDVRFETIRFDPRGRDNGRNGHINKEYLVIENHSDHGVNLNGWKLFDRERENRYVFDGLRLARTEQVYLYSGKGRDGGVTGCNGDCHSTFFLFWDRDHYVWDNGSDRAKLVDDTGDVIDRCSYTRADTSPHSC